MSYMSVQDFENGVAPMAPEAVSWTPEEDPNAALERELQARNTPISPSALYVSEHAAPDTYAVEEMQNFDVRGFCEAFDNIKRHLKNAEDMLSRIVAEKDAHYEAASKVFAHVSELNMDLEDANSITQIINSNSERYVSMLGEAAVRDRCKYWNEMYCRATPVLKLIRDELRMPSGDDDVVNPCPVCFVREVNTAVLPCGHTFCNDCAMKIIGTCFVCSAALHSKCRIYL
jgi:hypothetical protein